MCVYLFLTPKINPLLENDASQFSESANYRDDMSALRLLPCLAAITLPCQAFAPSTCRFLPRCPMHLSAAAATRRSFVDNVVGSASSSIAGAMILTTTPFEVRADDDETAQSPSQSSSSKIKPLPTYIYNVLRVREATEQETRLISTGKFKDVQRANVKLAVKFMINNYKLSDSIIAASSYLSGNSRVQASGVGQSAVQNLYTIIEYFDSSDVENIKVDSLSGKETLVNNGLKSVRRDLDDFLAFFPADVVNDARTKISMENELNFKEFDPSLGAILNPNPTK